MTTQDRTFSFRDHDETFMAHTSQQERPIDNSLRHPPIASRDPQQLQLQHPSYAIPPRGYTYSPQPPPHQYLQQNQTFPYLPPPPVSSDPYTQAPVLDPSDQGSHQFHDADFGQGLKYSDSTRTASTTTPGIDNMAASAAGGGIAGIAMGVANTNERESGVEALRSLESSHGLPPERAFDGFGSDTPYIPTTPSGFRPPNRLDPYASPAPSASNPFDDENRQISATPSPGQITPYQSRTGIPMYEYPSHEESLGAASSYSDNPYKRVSTAWDPRIGEGGDIDPNDIEDDGDDGMAHVPRRKPVDTSPSGGVGVGAAAGGGGGGGVLGALGGFVGRKNVVVEGERDPSGQYGPVPRSGFDDEGIEKSDWLKRQTSGRARMRWIVGIIIAILIIGGIVGGVIGGIRGARSSRSDSAPDKQGQSAEDDNRDNGDLGKDSAAIQQLMSNDALHKVFPGMAYTPFNAQYPACLTNPPSQNNVTRDMAVLSQLTNVIRLYGTDCNQTQMVLHAIDRLALTDMKVWLGVWLGGNSTTNNRQISDMYNILDKAGAEPFAGVVIGNEVLYAESITEAELAQVLADTKQNFTAQKIDLPVATSDLGDRWTAALASEVDVVMSNIHPFFAGVEVEEATGWTWNFWQTKDVVLTKGTTKKNIISEVGWPSEGGRSCGAVNCTDAITSSSVAGIDEMNRFMEDFVCQSLENGTDYFWYVWPLHPA